MSTPPESPVDGEDDRVKKRSFINFLSKNILILFNNAKQKAKQKTQMSQSETPPLFVKNPKTKTQNQNQNQKQTKKLCTKARM